MKTIVFAVAHELHTVVENNVRKKLSTISLLFKRLRLRALGGDLEAKKLLDQQRGKYQQEDTAPVLQGIIIPPRMDMETFMIHAAAQRERMLWAQANREQIWAEMGWDGSSSDAGREPLEKP